MEFGRNEGMREEVGSRECKLVLRLTRVLLHDVQGHLRREAKTCKDGFLLSSGRTRLQWSCRHAEYDQSRGLVDVNPPRSWGHGRWNAALVGWEMEQIGRFGGTRDGGCLVA